MRKQLLTELWGLPVVTRVISEEHVLFLGRRGLRGIYKKNSIVPEQFAIAVE